MPYYGRNFDILGFRDDEIHFCVGEVDLSASAGSGLDVLKCMKIIAHRFTKELTSSHGIRAEIEVTDQLTSPMIDSILDVLDRFPGLRALHVIQNCGPAPLLTLIGRLGRPKVLGDRVAWYLPNLEAISVNVQYLPLSGLNEVCWERRQAAAVMGCPKEIRELRVLPLNTLLGEECRLHVDYKTGWGLDTLQDALGRGQLFCGSEPWRRHVNGDGPKSTSSLLLW